MGPTHQRTSKQPLLGQCEPVVDESGGSGNPQVRKNGVVSIWREVAERNRGKAEKEKAGPAGPAKAAH